MIAYSMPNFNKNLSERLIIGTGYTPGGCTGIEASVSTLLLTEQQTEVTNL